MKPLRLALIVSELLLVLFLFFQPTIESRPLAHAIAAFSQDASPRNEAELEHQRLIARTRRLSALGVIALVFVVNSLGLVYVSRRVAVRHEVVA